MAPLEPQTIPTGVAPPATRAIAARRAVALGGPLADTYRATLAEFLNQPGRLGADPAGRAKKGEAAMSTIPIAPTIRITIGILLGMLLGLALTLATAIL